MCRCSPATTLVIGALAIPRRYPYSESCNSFTDQYIYHRTNSACALSDSLKHLPFFFLSFFGSTGSKLKKAACSLECLDIDIRTNSVPAIDLFAANRPPWTRPQNGTSSPTAKTMYVKLLYSLNYHVEKVCSA